jgi:hypothetical protein
MQTGASKVAETKLGLRLVTPGEINENLAVERAQLHAKNKANSWSQYLEYFDIFLGIELAFDETLGEFR